MERVYRKERARACTHTSYTPSARRSSEPCKPLFSTKKIAAQAAVSIVVFSLIYGISFFDNDFCKAVKNEAAYTVNYTVDLQNVYKSSQEIVKYLLGGIEQGKIYINSAMSGIAGTQTAESAPPPDESGLSQPSDIPAEVPVSGDIPAAQSGSESMAQSAEQ